MHKVAHFAGERSKVSSTGGLWEVLAGDDETRKPRLVDFSSDTAIHV